MLMIGQTISHYRILEKLGEGGVGVVYMAEDTRLQRTVALKFLSGNSSHQDEDRIRFMHEALAVAAIDHPNITAIHEIETLDGVTFIVMPCLQGMTLQDLIAKRALELREVVSIGLQVAKGLVAAHAKEILHRDIKPGNIMISENGQVQIMDFGLARLPDRTRITVDGTTFGTVAYMSPEQGTGSGVDQRTDIWSLGVVLYEILTRQLPFQGDHAQAVIYSILHVDPEPVKKLREGVPDELAGVIHKALAREPEDRYQEAGEIAEDLKALRWRLDSESYSSTGAWAFSRPRRRWPWIGVTALLTVLVLLLGWSWRMRSVDDLPTTNSLQVTSSEAWEGDPALSPDGGRIAYCSDEEGNLDIYLVSVTGGTPVRMTEHSAADRSPV